MWKEFEEKRKRVRTFLEKEGLEGVLLFQHRNFSWYTCGKDNFLILASEKGVSPLLIEKDSTTLFTTNIEAPRLREEEIGDLPIEIKEIPWERDLYEEISSYIKGKKIGADTPFPGTINVEEKIKELRYSLTPEEIERYYLLGRESAECVEGVLKGVREGIKEKEVAGRLAESLLSKNIIPEVILVAVDERIEKFRHPLFTDKKLFQYLMGVVCARRGGLVVALTRLVSLKKPSPELRNKHQAVTYVDTVLIANTLPGKVIGDILLEGIRAYKERGFPEEWKLHHQGGPIGYQTRDFLATRQEKRKVLPQQAFAWNPSITGTKSEDTIIAFPESPMIITSTPSWPKVKVEYKGKVWVRPDILVIGE